MNTTFHRRAAALTTALCVITTLTVPAVRAESAPPTAPSAAAAEHRLQPHPALQARALAPAIDPNLFIVQPPASVTWTVRPASDVSTRLAGASGAAAIAVTR